MGQTPFGGKGSWKASGCAARHDARTASEHLTPSSIFGQWNEKGSVAIAPEPSQRQLMHTASVSTSAFHTRPILCVQLNVAKFL